MEEIREGRGPLACWLVVGVEEQREMEKWRMVLGLELLLVVLGVDAELANTQALERTGSQRSQPDEVPRRPVRPVAPTGQTGWAQRASRRPRTSSSGGTPSELEDLGLS